MIRGIAAPAHQPGGLQPYSDEPLKVALEVAPASEAPPQLAPPTWMGRSLMRWMPSSTKVPRPAAATAAVSGRMAVPALPKNSSAPLEGKRPPQPCVPAQGKWAGKWACLQSPCWHNVLCEFRVACSAYSPMFCPAPPGRISTSGLVALTRLLPGCSSATVSCWPCLTLPP